MSSTHATILTDNEQKLLYSKPIFSLREQDYFFTLSDEENDYCSKLLNTFLKSHFILLLGYFKAKNIRLDLTWGDVKDDLRYINNRYFPKSSSYRKNLDDRSRRNLYRRIFRLRKYSSCTPEWRKKLKAHLTTVASTQMDKRHLFDETLSILPHWNIEIPAYSTLQDIISDVTHSIESRLEKQIEIELTVSHRESLEFLLKKDESRYNITLLKQFVKNFNYEQTGSAIKQRNMLMQLFPLAKSVIKHCGISLFNIVHLSNLTDYYTVDQLKKFPLEKASIYLLCFVYFQHQKLNDHLLHAFIKLVRKYVDQATEYRRDNQHNEAAILAKHVPHFSNIINLFIDTEVEETSPFSLIKEMAYRFIPKSEMPAISQYFSGVTLDNNHYHWKYYDSKLATISRNLRRLFLAIEFEVSNDHPILAGQLDRARDIFTQNTNELVIDKRLVKKSDTEVLFNAKPELQAKRCEWYLYQIIASYFDSCGIFVKDSLQYKRFNDYLVPLYEIKEKAISSSIVIPLDKTAAEVHIDELKQTMLSKLSKVSENVKSNNNSYVKIDANDQLKWHLPYKSDYNSVDSPFGLSKNPESIIQLLKWADQETSYSHLFKHVRNQKRHTALDMDNILACLVANGTNVGIFKLSKMSDRIHQALLQTQANYLTVDTLSAANNCISNQISSLLIYDSYRTSQGQVHASIDGQKFTTRHSQVLARYSPKYFGLQPGISILTLVAGHLPINSKIISANEHESHHIYDLLFNQSTDLKPDAISTDQHGINAFNFAIMNAFGYQFAPRFAKIKKHFGSHFNILNSNDDKKLIQIKKSIKWQLILDEWDNIVQILISLEQKNTTQEFLVKKLCNYKKHSKTLKALNEYDRVYRLIYLLDYIDDESLRRNVQRSLCNGESFHQMQRSIASVNGSDSIVGRYESEIKIWNESSKLIANCILLYNATILSKLLKHYQQTNNQAGIDRITNASPVAWSHIILGGMFSFASNDDVFQIENIIEDLKMAI